MKTFDLIVVGAGIVGAACADAAAAEKLRIAVVEADIVGGGATAAAMGHLVALDDDPAELALARYSLTLWEELRELPAAQFDRCGTLWLARSDEEFAAIEAKIERLRRVSIGAEAIAGSELNRLEPALAPGLRGGLLVASDAVVYAPNVARFLIERARGRGAEILLRRRAVALDDDGVLLEDRTHLAGPVLLATGCALPDLLPMLPLRPRKGHLVMTGRCPGFIRHQLLELGYTESARGAAASSVAFNVQPRRTGQILIGSSREFGSVGREVSLPTVHRMLARALEYLPGLRTLEVLRAWSGLRPTSLDGRPYLGAVPDRRQVWVAAGHEGLGITTALGSARVVVDLLLGRGCAIDPAPFAPARALS
ncbi:MAG TPA: FAD-dependent oxidoreductase [Steroidobacteraceae bacterium]|nr:FAD-dependent oxidoreductase [Steroidobacteraceae bacterium]